MKKHDEEMERYLEKFQPRAVRDLDLQRQSKNVWIRRLAAAAVVILVGGLSLWYAQRETPGSREAGTISEVRNNFDDPRSSTNTLYLTKLALEDNQAFDALLSKESRMELPGMQGEQSILRVLAKE